MNKNKTLLVLLLFFALYNIASTFQTDSDADKLVGVWEPSNGRSKIKIEKIGTKYYGKIVWLKNPIDPNTEKPKVDKNNPDTTMRKVPLKGYRILKDFIYKGNKEWSDGTIYDPENGSTYSCTINMKEENLLDIRGYIGVKALGRTDTWSRVILK
jgi:uncharacterized protein (DUF2147 family)